LFMRDGLHDWAERVFLEKICGTDYQRKKFVVVKNNKLERENCEVYQKFQEFISKPPLQLHSDDKLHIERLFMNLPCGKEFVKLLYAKDEERKGNKLWDTFLDYKKNRGYSTIAPDAHAKFEIPAFDFCNYKNVLSNSRRLLKNKSNVLQAMNNVSRFVKGFLECEDDNFYMIALTIMIMFNNIQFPKEIQELVAITWRRITFDTYGIKTNILVKKTMIYLLLYANNFGVDSFQTYYGDFDQFVVKVFLMQWDNQKYLKIIRSLTKRKIECDIFSLAQFEGIGDDIYWLNEINLAVSEFKW